MPSFPYTDPVAIRTRTQHPIGQSDNRSPRQKWYDQYRESVCITYIIFANLSKPHVNKIYVLSYTKYKFSLQLGVPSFRYTDPLWEHRADRVLEPNTDSTIRTRTQHPAANGPVFMPAYHYLTDTETDAEAAARAAEEAHQQTQRPALLYGRTEQANEVRRYLLKAYYLLHAASF